MFSTTAFHWPALLLSCLYDNKLTKAEIIHPPFYDGGILKSSQVFTRNLAFKTKRNHESLL